MPTETVNGTELAYEVTGHGPPVVVIHGSWGERQGWAFFLPGLSSSFQAVAYDRRGHGESAADPEAGTVHDDVADAAALIERLGVAPAHIVANSYGACVALRLAGQRPDLVDAMVCHEPPLLGLLETSPDSKAIAAEQWQLLGEVRDRLERGAPAEAAEYFVEHVALGPGMWEQLPPPMQEGMVHHAPTFLGELRDPDALQPDLDALAQLAAPVLLTRGDQSPPMFGPLVQLLGELMPNARTQTIPGAGHVPHITHPDDYVDAVRDFLRESSS